MNADSNGGAAMQSLAEIKAGHACTIKWMLGNPQVHSNYHAVPSLLEHIDGTSLPDAIPVHKLPNLGISQHPFNCTGMSLSLIHISPVRPAYNMRN